MCCRDPNAPGIPNFWLNIFKNVAILNDMVQAHDEPIIKHLQDIKVKFLEKDPMVNIFLSVVPYNFYVSSSTKLLNVKAKHEFTCVLFQGFILEFHFSENPFFTNKVLTKEYFMKCVPDEHDPFGFEGPEIYKCKVI